MCIVPAATLYAASYALLQLNEVWAKVSATNLYGTSEISVEGNTGVVVFVPDAPINLRDWVEVTSAYVMGLNWEDAPNNGGKDVIDYVISSDQSIGEWVDYAHGVSTNGPSFTQ